MRSARKEVWYVLSLAAGAGAAHMLGLAPLLLTAPALLAFTVAAPAFYLAVLAVIAELFATTTPGLMTLVTFLPWLLARLFKKNPVDISFSFLLLTMAALGAQFAALFLPNMLTAARQAETLGAAARAAAGALPWPLVPQLALIAGAVYTAAIIIHYNRS